MNEFKMLNRKSPVVIYVVGLPYSGTTLLSSLLGNSPGILNLGEINYLENDYSDERKCLCQESLSECSFWRRIVEKTKQSQDNGNPVLNFTSEQKLRKIDMRSKPISTKIGKAIGIKIGRLYGHEELIDYTQRHKNFFLDVSEIEKPNSIIDSSKSTQRLEAMREFTDLPIRVICIKKSFRSAFQSRIARAKKRSRRYFSITSIYYASVMMAQIRNLRRTLSRFDTDEVIQIDFDDLRQHPQQIEQDLGDWLGQEVNFGVKADSTFKIRNQHAYTGNIWMTRLQSKEPEIQLKPNSAVSTLSPFETWVARIFSIFAAEKTTQR